MPKYPKYKYEFEIDGELFLLAIGESKKSKHDVIVKVQKFETTNEMNRLWITLDNGNWTNLEHGKRTPNGIVREEFKRFQMNYPAYGGNVGNKIKEVF